VCSCLYKREMKCEVNEKDAGEMMWRMRSCFAWLLLVVVKSVRACVRDVCRPYLAYVPVPVPYCIIPRRKGFFSGRLRLVGWFVLSVS